MKQGMHQSTSMRQDMRMNPRLYQAMDLLYMPLLDLQQHLKQELLTNPFLELVESEEENPAETPTPDKKQEAEEATAKEETDWEDILLDGFQVGASRGDFAEGEFMERVTVDTRDLTDHLRDQLQLLDLTPRQRFLAEEFVGNIGEDGYLHATLDEIVQGANDMMAGFQRHRAEAAASPDDDDEELGVESELDDAPAFAQAPVAVTTPNPVVVPQPADAPAGVLEREPGIEDLEVPDLPAPPPTDGTVPFTVTEVEQMLAIFQKLDPAGIGARNLRECLLLQLEDGKQQDTLTYRLVRDEYDDLITHRWSELAKRYGLDPRDVQDAADVLAKLDPKPGLRFASSDDGYIVPDLTVQKIDGAYRVFLNDAGTPRLRISKVYQDLAGDKKKFVGESREFVTEKLNSASWLIQAIEQRRQTMLKVMNFIIDRQREYFEKGVEYLKPLTLREVADVIEMHESTVSRVTSQKYVQTPRGVLPLKFFFSSSLGTTTGEDASARAVKAQIQKLVADEKPATPLTDSEIVSALRARGIQIARRTVAKYRDQLSILPGPDAETGMTLAGRDGSVDVSVLVPAKDEAENLPEFVSQCSVALASAPYRCEVIVVNDGSEDDSAQVLDGLVRQYPFLRVVTHRTRRGIADALRSGGDAARGRILVFYPADLQFSPSEIPGLVEPIVGREADIVTGTKQGKYEKAFVSGVYNWLCRKLFGVRATDLNAVKAYRREVMDAVPARPEWHRFMVVIAAAEGFRVTERPVTLHPRRAGRSKFGISRIPVGALDLLSVWFQMRFGRKPMLFFGISGGLVFALGFAVGLAALIIRFGYGYGFRPLLDLVMVLVISGIALFGFGFVGEMLAGAREELRTLQRSVDRVAAELERHRQ